MDCICNIIGKIHQFSFRTFTTFMGLVGLVSPGPIEFILFTGIGSPFSTTFWRIKLPLPRVFENRIESRSR